MSNGKPTTVTGKQIVTRSSEKEIVSKEVEVKATEKKVPKEEQS